MRVFTVSDIHIDYQENFQWLSNLSNSDFQSDILILGGDIAGSISLIDNAFQVLSRKFQKVVFVAGNHDLWVSQAQKIDSFEKLNQIKERADCNGILMSPLNLNHLLIVPLYSWYDYSFGNPSPELRSTWMDYASCAWPQDQKDPDITKSFLAMNEKYLSLSNKFVITFSHFLPRIDLMPYYIPPQYTTLYPVLGTASLDRQIQAFRSNIHVYGHSHINVDVIKNGIRYVNNAYGYPHELRISRKCLFCIYES